VVSDPVTVSQELVANQADIDPIRNSFWHFQIIEEANEKKVAAQLPLMLEGQLDFLRNPGRAQGIPG
jgi:hypothetical protein